MSNSGSIRKKGSLPATLDREVWTEKLLSVDGTDYIHFTAWAMHSMFRALFGVPHLLARELLMNSPHCGKKYYKWKAAVNARNVMHFLLLYYSTWEELDKFKCPEAKCREKPWKVRARTYGTKSPSRSEALRFIDSAKSPSTKIDGSLVNFRRRLSNRHGRPRRMLTMDIRRTL